MSNLVPFSTINFECYTNDRRLRGLVNVDLPEFNYVETEISGVNILGKFGVPVRGHTDNLECTLHFRVILVDDTSFLEHDAHDFELRGAWERYDAGSGKREVIPIKIMMRGLTKSLKLGKMEPAESTETEVTLSISYIKVTVNGTDLIEHDKFNYIHRIGTNSYMAAVRSALGL